MPAPASEPDVAQNPQAQQYQLGSYSLQAVDQLTGTSADEIEVVADRLVDGARETEELLRELAHQVRENGVIVNERLANFVKAANACAEVARTMQASLEQRDQQSATESVSETKVRAPEPARARVSRDQHLDALEAEIKAVAHDRAPPLQPGD